MQIERSTGLASITLFVSIAFSVNAYASCSDKRAPEVDWSGCKKSRKMLYEQNFSGGRFDEANFSLSRMHESDFSRASLIKADLTRADLKNANFTLSNMTKAVGYRTDFSGSEFSATIMQKSEFSRASFKGATFVNVDWSRSELGRIDLTNARLQGVLFEYSNLARAQFSGAQLSNVDFLGAYTYLTRFEGVDLRQVRRLSQAQLDIACGNPKTLLPDGLQTPASWPCEEQ